MENRNIILFGNGVNYFIKNFLEKQNISEELKIDINNNLSIISNIWKEFDELLGELTKDLKNYDNSIGDEDVFELLQYFFKHFKSLNDKLHKININECITQIENFFEDEKLTKLLKIIQDRLIQENNGFYKKLSENIEIHNLKIIELKNLFRKENIHINIYTMNYDYVIDTIFGSKSFKDNFGNCPEFIGKFKDSKYLCYKEYFEDNLRLFHLHGSYKLLQLNEKVIKIRKETVENFKVFQEEVESNNDKIFPSIVYDSKEKKEQIIQNNEVLSKYFTHYKYTIQQATNIIIFGLSLKNDFHIAKYIFLSDKNRQVNLTIIGEEDTLNNLIKWFERSKTENLISQSSIYEKNERVFKTNNKRINVSLVNHQSLKYLSDLKNYIKYEEPKIN